MVACCAPLPTVDAPAAAGDAPDALPAVRPIVVTSVPSTTSAPQPVTRVAETGILLRLIALTPGGRGPLGYSFGVFPLQSQSLEDPVATARVVTDTDPAMT